MVGVVSQPRLAEAQKFEPFQMSSSPYGLKTKNHLPPFSAKNSITSREEVFSISEMDVLVPTWPPNQPPSRRTSDVTHRPLMTEVPVSRPEVSDFVTNPETAENFPMTDSDVATTTTSATLVPDASQISRK